MISITKWIIFIIFYIFQESQSFRIMSKRKNSIPKLNNFDIQSLDLDIKTVSIIGSGTLSTVCIYLYSNATNASLNVIKKDLEDNRIMIQTYSKTTNIIVI